MDSTNIPWPWFSRYNLCLLDSQQIHFQDSLNAMKWDCLWASADTKSMSVFVFSIRPLIFITTAFYLHYKIDLLESVAWQLFVKDRKIPERDRGLNKNSALLVKFVAFKLKCPGNMNSLNASPQHFWNHFPENFIPLKWTRNKTNQEQTNFWIAKLFLIQIFPYRDFKRDNYFVGSY